ADLGSCGARRRPQISGNCCRYFAGRRNLHGRCHCQWRVCKCARKLRTKPARILVGQVHIYIRKMLLLCSRQLPVLEVKVDMLLKLEFDALVASAYMEGKTRFGELGLELDTFSARISAILKKHLGPSPGPSET